MANKYDLKTWAVMGLPATGTATGGTNIGGVIANGKTRFLTYIRATRDASASALVASLTVGIGAVTTSHPDAASVLAAAYLKLPLMFPQATANSLNSRSLRHEIQGSIEHPILSITGTGANFMGVAASETAAQLFDVFAVYYDD